MAWVFLKALYVTSGLRKAARESFRLAETAAPRIRVSEFKARATLLSRLYEQLEQPRKPAKDHLNTQRHAAVENRTLR